MALCIDFRFLDTVAIGTFDIAQIDSSIVIQSYFQVAELSYGDCFDAYTGSSDVALVTLVAFFALHGAQIDALAVGERQHQLVFGIDLRSGDAHAILTGGTGVTFLALFTLDALFTLGAGGTGITLFTLDTLHTLCADVTLVALFTFITLGADHSAQCIRASIAVGNHQLAIRIDDSGGHAHAVLTGGTGVAFVTFFTPDTLSTLCTGVAFVAFLTLGTLHSTEVFDLSVGIGQHQLAGCIDVGCGDAISGLTLFTGSTGVALVTFLAPDVAQLQLCTTGESDGQVAGSNVNILDADTVLAVLTGGTGITLFTLFTFLTLGADYGAEVFDGVVGISKYKLTTIIQLAFQNAKAVLSGSAGITLFAPDTLSALCTGVAFVTLVTFFTLHTGGTHDRADICPLVVGENQHQLALTVDLGGNHADTVRTGITLVTLFALDALLALGAGGTGIALVALFTLDSGSTGITFFAPGTDHLPQIGNLPVGIGQDQVAAPVNGGSGHADTGGTFFALRTGGAGITLFTLGADYSAEVCGLSVGIGQHQLAVRIDLRIRNTDPVLSVGAGDLVKIDGLSVRKCQQQLSFFVDFRINDADTGGTVGAILAIGTICAVLAVCSCSADSSAYIQTAAVGEKQNQLSRLIKGCTLNADRISLCVRRKRSGEIALRPCIAALLGNLVCALPIQRSQPVLHSSFITVCLRDFIRRQAVFDSGRRFFAGKNTCAH